MKVGTKSLLFGAHCVPIHTFFIALAWWRLYGFKRVPAFGYPRPCVKVSLLNPILWLCFLVHDIGYWGCADMDGAEGENHPKLGAKVVGWAMNHLTTQFSAINWHDFVLHHSRFLAKKSDQPVSALCAADKLVPTLEPWWLYLPRAIASGEVDEYVQLADAGRTKDFKYDHSRSKMQNRRAWFRSMAEYSRAWALEHADGKVDRWTPATNNH